MVFVRVDSEWLKVHSTRSGRRYAQLGVAFGILDSEWSGIHSTRSGQGFTRLGVVKDSLDSELLKVCSTRSGQGFTQLGVAECTFGRRDSAWTGIPSWTPDSGPYWRGWNLLYLRYADGCLGLLVTLYLQWREVESLHEGLTTKVTDMVRTSNLAIELCPLR